MQSERREMDKCRLISDGSELMSLVELLSTLGSATSVPCLHSLPLSIGKMFVSSRQLLW